MKSDSLESKLNSSDLKGKVREMRIEIKDVKRFWLQHRNIIGAEAELVIEMGEGRQFKYKKTPEAEEFYNNLRFSKDFAEFAGKSIKKSLINKIELKGDLSNPKIWIYILGYKNPIEIGPELRVSRSDIGMFDTFEYLKKIFNH